MSGMTINLDELQNGSKAVTGTEANKGNSDKDREDSLKARIDKFKNREEPAPNSPDKNSKAEGTQDSAKKDKAEGVQGSDKKEQEEPLSKNAQKKMARTLHQAELRTSKIVDAIRDLYDLKGKNYSLEEEQLTEMMSCIHQELSEVENYLRLNGEKQLSFKFTKNQ